MKTFVSELRRRNVLRVAAAYALVAWILIEAGSVLMPTFGAPDGAFQTYVIVVIVGFVLSLIFVWIFELTPEGLKLDRDVSRELPANPQTKQRLNYATIALLVLALSVSITFNVTDIRSDATPAAKAAGGRSIAVLPFESVSTNPENLLFADGIHDDVLNRLGNNQGLKVISRTSVLPYRDSTKSEREIGEELGVDTILTGTVQRRGDTVRINMTLADAESANQLWTRTYDKQLTMQDIFEVQSDIANSIAIELRAALTPTSAVQRKPTSNLVAYNRYAEARRNLAERNYTAMIEAKRQFAEAIELDPDFAEAHAGLASSYLLLYINYKTGERNEVFPAIEAELERALSLNPDLADAHATAGLLQATLWDETRLGNENILAEQAYQRALALNPNHASASMWFASLRESEGRLDDAISLYEKSIDIDPLGRIPYVNLPGIYAQLGQNKHALDALIRATELHPDWQTPYQYIAQHLNLLGRADEAMAWFNKAKELSGELDIAGNMEIGILAAFDELQRAKDLLEATPDENPIADFVPGFVRLLDGDFAGSLELLLQAIAEQPTRPRPLYNLVANVAMLAGDFETAEEFIYLYQPVLARDSEVQIDRYTVNSVVQLAYILQQRDKNQAAYDLLVDALPVAQSRPRLGMAGIGIVDVQILALLGRTEDSLEALTAAVANGFRSTATFNFWLLDQDPYLVSIRDHDRFAELQQQIKVDLDRMKDNFMRAESTGDWVPLRQIAIAQASSGLLARLGN